MSSAKASTYGQGHHTAVTANHVIRTAEADAAFLLPYLKPHHRILDVGCGPGSITTGFAKYVPEGSIIGIDLTPEILKQAQDFLNNQDPTPENAFRRQTFRRGVLQPDSDPHT
jgi:ubiquinone/menaquinone biosynthesis C-methylase UbiE